MYPETVDSIHATSKKAGQNKMPLSYTHRYTRTSTDLVEEAEGSARSVGGGHKRLYKRMNEKEQKNELKSMVQTIGIK